MANKSIDPNLLLTIGVLGIGGYAAYTLLKAPKDEGDPYAGEPYTDPELPPPTMTVSESRILADRIYAAFYGGGGWGDWGHPGEDEEAVIAALIVPRNTNDVLQLIDTYGERQSFWSVDNALDLPQAIREFLSPDDIQRVNLYYANNLIAVRF